MHMCCAPCGTYPLKKLRELACDVTGFFYNPNIHPLPENIRRKETTEDFAFELNMKLIAMGSFNQKKWEEYGENDPKRCEMCYLDRIEKTAIVAKESGYDAFTTTLLVSPYQNHELMKIIGEKMENKYNISFKYIDFRPFFKEGQNMAREMGLYRQKYCGCIHSYNQSKFKDKIKWD